MATPTDFDGTKSNDDISTDDDLSPSAETQEAEGPVNNDAPKITLTKEQLSAAGLDNLEPGDAFTVTVHGTATDTDDAGGMVADIDELTDGILKDVIPDAKPDLKPVRQGPQIKGPGDAGMLSSSPMLPDDSQT